MERPMKGYWWECTSCSDCFKFKSVTKSRSVASFVWDELVPSGWDQSLLLRTCPSCKADNLRITYDFPKKSSRDIIQVNHIVGYTEEGRNYIPMLWETVPNNSATTQWYDFKYQIKRNNNGLNKPAVMKPNELKHLFEKFKSLTGKDVLS